jgi:hypothetical protein
MSIIINTNKFDDNAENLAYQILTAYDPVNYPALPEVERARPPFNDVLEDLLYLILGKIGEGSPGGGNSTPPVNIDAYNMANNPQWSVDLIGTVNVHPNESIWVLVPDSFNTGDLPVTPNSNGVTKWVQISVEIEDRLNSPEAKKALSALKGRELYQNKLEYDRIIRVTDADLVFNAGLNRYEYNIVFEPENIELADTTKNSFQFLILGATLTNPEFYATVVSTTAAIQNAESLQGTFFRMNSDNLQFVRITFVRVPSSSTVFDAFLEHLNGWYPDGENILYRGQAQANYLRAVARMYHNALPLLTDTLDPRYPTAAMRPVGWNFATKEFLDLQTGFSANYTYYIDPDAGSDALAVPGDRNRPYKTVGGVRAVINTNVNVNNLLITNLNNPASKRRLVVFCAGTHTIDSATSGPGDGSAWEIPYGKILFFCEPGAILNIFVPFFCPTRGRRINTATANPSIYEVQSDTSIPAIERYYGIFGYGIINSYTGTNLFPVHTGSVKTTTGAISGTATTNTNYPILLQCKELNILCINTLQDSALARISTAAGLGSIGTGAKNITQCIAEKVTTFVTDQANQTLIINSCDIQDVSITASYTDGIVPTITENTANWFLSLFGGRVNAITIANSTFDTNVPAVYLSNIEVGRIFGTHTGSYVNSLFIQARNTVRIREVTGARTAPTTKLVMIGFIANVSIETSYENLEYRLINAVSSTANSRHYGIRADLLGALSIRAQQGQTAAQINAIPLFVDVKYIKQITISTMRFYQLHFLSALRTINTISINPDTHTPPTAADITFWQNVEILLSATTGIPAINIALTGGYADNISDGTYARKKLQIRNYANIITNANFTAVFGGAVGNIINTDYHQETRGFFIDDTNTPTLENNSDLPSYALALPSRGMYRNQRLSAFFVI